MQKINPKLGMVERVNGEVIPPESTPRLSVWKLILAGVISPVLINNISRILNVWNGEGFYAVALVIFLFTGLFVAYLIPKPTHAILGGLISYVNISAGVFVDAQIDWSLRAYDRNLWPFEILIWWVLAPIPMITGIMLAYIFRKKIKGPLYDR